MINLYRLEKIGASPISLPDMSSLDAITRQLPDGYYSTFRTYDGCTRVLGLKSHLRRLFDPVTAPEVTASELRQELLSLLEPFRPDEARVRVMITKQGKVYVAMEPLKLLPTEFYENGVHVETTEIQRNNPRLKSTLFIGESASERMHIAQEGIFEALLVKNGRILEGMTSNFFYVINTHAERNDEWFPRRADEARIGNIHGASSAEPQTAFGSSAQRDVLFTAQRDVLLGVTRKTVIQLARSRGVEVKYRPLKLSQLSQVKEAFITSSSRGVVPIIQIDEATIGQGRPGQITRMLITAYNEYVLEHAEKI